MSELLAIGVDGARGGWLAALAFGGAGRVERTELRLEPGLAAIAELAHDAGVILAVDIPIGLEERNGFRACELQARALLGPRRSSVFASPGRRFINAASYAEARALVDELRAAGSGAFGGGPEIKSLSAQTWGIVPKIREADQVATSFPDAAVWLWECHPELSFRAMRGGERAAGGPEPLPPKSRAAGQAARLALIVEHFPDALEQIAALPENAPADLTDAADAYAALWSALRIGLGEHEVLGDGRADARGVPMRMGF